VRLRAIQSSPGPTFFAARFHPCQPRCDERDTLAADSANLAAAQPRDALRRKSSGVLCPLAAGGRTRCSAEPRFCLGGNELRAGPASRAQPPTTRLHVLLLVRRLRVPLSL